MKSIRNSKGLYWGLIIAFFALYMLVGFVSTLHSITFFELANTMWMAVLLGITYEIGQAAVLFSILMSDNSKKILPWLLMFLLTALQVTANVYASFKFMDGSGSNDWTFWQRSILFWLEADGPEMFKVVISWISGALLPVVALGMTALVAENLKLKDEQEETKLGGDILESAGPDPDDLPPTEEDVSEPTEENVPEAVSVPTEAMGGFEMLDNYPGNLGKSASNASYEPEYKDTTIQEDVEKIKEQEADPSGVEPIQAPKKEEQLKVLAEELLDPKNHIKFPKDAKVPPDTRGEATVIKEPVIISLQDDLGAKPGELEPIAKPGWVDEGLKRSFPEDNKSFDKDPNTGKYEKKPVNNVRGWHLKKEFVDTNGDVYRFGQLVDPILDKVIKRNPPKKA